MSYDSILLGAVFAAVVVVIAGRAGALSGGGAVAAFFVGTLTFGTLRFTGAAVLLAFFVPAVVLSRVGRARKRELVDIGKHGPRDAMQVLANGGVATACALASLGWHDVRWEFAFAGAYAAAAADTWGTEIGTLLRQPPRSILTLRSVATGISGGVTLAGTLAEIAGAAWIGCVLIGMLWLGLSAAMHARGLSIPPSVFAPMMFERPLALLVVAVPLGGIAGALVDSVLGATVQELRFCDACGRSCETDPHVCGSRTRVVRGIPRFSNDAVNLLATVTGAAVGFALS